MKRPCIIVSLGFLVAGLTGCPPPPPRDDDSQSNLDDRNGSSDDGCESGFVLAAADACCPEDYPELGADGRCHQRSSGNGGFEPEACNGNAAAIIAPTVETYVLLEDGSVYNADDAVKSWRVGDCIQFETRTEETLGTWIPSFCDLSGFCTGGYITGGSTSTETTLLNVRTAQMSNAGKPDMVGFYIFARIVDFASGARWVELDNREQYPVDPDDYATVATWRAGQRVGLSNDLLINIESGYVVRLLEKNSTNGCCVVSGGGLGCNSQATMACVCSRDQFCCDGEWDRRCVALAKYYGCKTCSAIGDPCEVLEWYGDGECDNACPQLDSDCTRGVGGGGGGTTPTLVDNWLVFEDTVSGTFCDVVNGADVEAIFLSPSHEMLIVTGTDVPIALFLDGLDVLDSSGEVVGYVTFATDGDGLRSVFLFEPDGTVFALDRNLAGHGPEYFVDVKCAACPLMDNPGPGACPE